jgi:hypothetical protein
VTLKPTSLRKEIDTPTLKRLCDHAQELKFANGPNDRFWQSVDPKGIHVCTESYYHSPNFAFWQGIDHGFNFAHNNGVNIRAVMLCKMKGSRKPVHLLCDFDEQDFKALPDLNVKTPKERARQRQRRCPRAARVKAEGGAR